MTVRYKAKPLTAEREYLEIGVQAAEAIAWVLRAAYRCACLEADEVVPIYLCPRGSA